MKASQSRLLVGLLVGAALGLVIYNLWGPVLSRLPWFRRGPAGGATSASTTALTATAGVSNSTVLILPAGASAAIGRSTSKSNAPTPAAPVDLSVALSQSPRWMESPRRDPFHLRVEGTKPTNALPSAMEVLFLNAVWRQSGSSLAVINNQVVGEGDTIPPFRVESIGAEHVWVNGPSGREMVPFSYRNPPAFDYRVVNGVTNNVRTDPNWNIISGTVKEKVSERTYRVSLSTNLVVVVKNLPRAYVDGSELTEMCKSVGVETYEVRTNDRKNETLAAYDYGVPCEPPKDAVNRRENRKAIQLNQYGEISVRRAKLDAAAAASGSAAAQFVLGRRYLEGEGVPKDVQQAHHWFEQSAAQGNADALTALATWPVAATEH